jgi:hypothetical protein
LVPMIQKTKHKLMRKALSALYQYAYYKYKVKGKIQRALKKYHKNLKAQAFSVLLDNVLDRKEYAL